MDKLPARYKGKNKKPNPKSKSAKKHKSDGPTCSMFLAELARKLALKKKIEEESPKNVVQTIIDSLTNALPVRLLKRTPQKYPSPMKMETLQFYAPELLPNDTIRVLPTNSNKDENDELMDEVEITSQKTGFFRMPKMPVNDSEVLRMAIPKRQMQDESVNTCPEHDVATELTKHVNTLKKISLIAEEFNHKTAKNLKEIVSSVQEELVTKLEEFQTEQRIITPQHKLINYVPEENEETNE